jgi:hypothetical protein
MRTLNGADRRRWQSSPDDDVPCAASFSLALFVVDKVPTLTVDDSNATEKHVTGTRSMGAAIGTMHKGDNV